MPRRLANITESLSAQLQKLLPYDPAIAAWLAVTIACICIFHLFRSPSADGYVEIGWSLLTAGLAKALGFTALVLMTSALLAAGYASFSRVYGSFTTGGSLSNQAWERWHAVYGEPLIQHELEVTHYVTTSSVQEILTDDANQPVRYITGTSEDVLEQNSITAFNGMVTVNLFDPWHQEDSYNAFAASALYQYEISNTSNQPTRASYRFPIDNHQRIFRDIHVRVNGEEFEDWDAADNSLTWNLPMQPGQIDKVEVQYETWGMNGYTYMLDRPREVRNFQLKLAFETDNH